MSSSGRQARSSTKSDSSKSTASVTHKETYERSKEAYVALQSNSDRLIKSLKNLDEQLAKSHLKKRDEMLASIQSRLASSSIECGIYKIGEDTYWVLPESFMAEDSILGHMITDFAYITGAKIKLNEKEPGKKTELFDEDFITGLWFGIYSNTVQKLNRNKVGYELGRTCTYALTVKNLFARDPYLGLGALKPDNFFFGNAPNENVKKGKSVYVIKHRLRSYFENSNLGDAIFGILNATVSKVMFSNLSDPDITVVEQNIIPFDQVLIKHYPSYVVQGKKGKAKEQRKPNPIRNSPLLFKEEVEILQNLTAPLFSDLWAFEKDYIGQVRARGFSELNQRIKETISVRLEILQRFANRTKIRLQDIRKITEQPKKRKATVVRDDIVALAKSEPNPAARLYQELLYVMGGQNIQRLISQAYNKKFSTLEAAKLFLLRKCYDIYVKLKITTHEIVIPNELMSLRESEEIEFEKAYKAIFEFDKKYTKARFNIDRISAQKYPQIYGRQNHLKGQFVNIADLKRQIDGLSTDTIRDSAIDYYSGGKVKNFDVYVTGVIKDLAESIRKEINGLKRRINETSIESEKLLLTSVIELLSSFLE